MAKSIYIIIVTWNARKFIRECLASLSNQNTDDYGIIVVDNKSSDDTCQIVKEEFPEAILIRNDNNDGFAAGNNIGIDQALKLGARYVALLNQDTEVDGNYIKASLDYLEQNRNVGLASPIICFPQEKRIWFAGSKIFRGMSILAHPTSKIGTHINKKKILSDSDINNHADWIPGCSLFIRKEVIDKIGKLDDSFFMYGEDVDFSIRARLAGFQLGLIGGTIVTHKEALKRKIKINQALFKKIYLMSTSRYRVIKRYFTAQEKCYYVIKLIYTPFIQLFHVVRKIFS